MTEPKDSWDKLEIIAKVLTPVVVGISVYLWNEERTEVNSATAMVEVAISVLSDIPKGEGGDPLRDWAISVLERPGKPPVLTKDAAAQLRLRALPEISSATLDTAMQLCSGSFPLSLHPGTSQTEFDVNYLECISTLLSSLTAQAH